MKIRKSTACVFALCWVLAAGGCATTASFETVGGEEGRIGRYYELDVGGRNWGDARIWSPGAHPVEADGENAVVQLNLRLRNDSTEPLTLDLERSELEIATEDGNSYLIEDIQRIVGVERVPPEATERLELFFALPGSVSPRDIQNLELSWVIRTSGGVYSQSTPFVRDRWSDRETG